MSKAFQNWSAQVKSELERQVKCVLHHFLSEAPGSNFHLHFSTDASGSMNRLKIRSVAVYMTYSTFERKLQGSNV